MALATAFKKLSHHLRGVGAEFVEGNGKVCEESTLLSSPSTKGSKYDYISTVWRLSHYAKPEKILSVWWASLNPGGVLLLILPDDRFYYRVGTPECNREHKLDFNYEVVETMMGMVAPNAELMEKSFDDGACSFWMVYRKPGQLNVQNSIVQKTLRYFKQMPKYDIVIPVYGKHDLLRQCLNSITNAGWTPENVIIVHDHDGEELRGDWYKAWDNYAPQKFRVTVLQTRKRLGFAGAVNKGVKECRNKSVILLNTDVTVKPDGDKKLLAALRRSSVGIVGQSGGRLDESFAYAGEGLDYIEMYCCAFRKSVFDDLGGLDEQFFPGYGEDSDFGIRLRKAGYSIVTADDVCKHIGNQSFGKSAELNKIIEEHRITLQKKHQRGRVVFVCASTGMSGGIRVIWNVAQALREAGWVTAAYFVGFKLDRKDLRAEWRDFEIWDEGTLSTCKEPWDIVMATYQSTVPHAEKLKGTHHLFLVQSDEPEWFRPNPEGFAVVKQNFENKNFKHIIIGDYMWSFKEKYGMDIICKLDNGIDDLEFMPLWDLYQERIERKPTIVTTRKGSPVWYDGVEELDAAVQAIDIKKFPGLNYISIGSGHNKNNKFNCEYKEVKTHNGTEVCKLLNSATIYCHPCKIEGSSLAVMEALACGLPIICADLACDAIVDGYNGIVIKHGTVKEWKAAIEKVLGDPVLQKTLSQNALISMKHRTTAAQRKQCVEEINKFMGEK